MPTKNDARVSRVAVVGTGLIGAGWAAHFLAHGLDVIATDPAPNAKEKLIEFVDRVWPLLEQLGLHKDAARDRLRFTPDMREAVAEADFVQENAPERIQAKIDLFAAMDAVAPPAVILASSSSGLMMSAIQSGCRHPERCVIGHPFNPPYLIPLVEVVGGAKTSAESISKAMTFYTDSGKRPIHILKELPGHIANRLQAALWREALYMVDEGVASVADVDAAVSWGPGLRWGVMGPSLTFHLAGGRGGISYFLDHLTGPLRTWWEPLGKAELTPQLISKLIQGVADEAGDRSIEALNLERDRVVMGLLKLRRENPE